MMDGLTEEAKILIEHCPALVNKLAEKVNSLIDNWDTLDTDLEPIEIAHVSYTSEQMGYEK